MQVIELVLSKFKILHEKDFHNYSNRKLAIPVNRFAATIYPNFL